MTLNIWAMPLWLSPTSQPTAGRPCWPNVSSQVGEDFRPILCSTSDVDAVALTGFAGLGIEMELWHRKQAQALGPRTGAFRPGQNQVQDVLVQVVGITVGDEPLDAVEVPGAVGLLDRLGAAGADVRSGVGFGQNHRGGPIPVGHQRRPVPLLLVADA